MVNDFTASLVAQAQDLGGDVMAELEGAIKKVKADNLDRLDSPEPVSLRFDSLPENWFAELDAAMKLISTDMAADMDKVVEAYIALKKAEAEKMRKAQAEELSKRLAA